MSALPITRAESAADRLYWRGFALVAGQIMQAGQGVGPVIATLVCASPAPVHVKRFPRLFIDDRYGPYLTPRSVYSLMVAVRVCLSDLGYPDAIEKVEPTVGGTWGGYRLSKATADAIREMVEARA